MGWNTTYPSAPIFVADWNSIDRNTGRQVDWTQVPASYTAGVSHTITAEAAIATATSITVSALTADMPAGTILNFEGKLAELTAPASVGDTTLTVAALAEAIDVGDVATFLVSESGDKVLEAGTVVSQLANGKIVPRVVSAGEGAAGAIGLLMTAAQENSRTDALTGYAVIVGGVIYETLLPEVITAYKTELETNGMSWVWAVYADDTAVQA